VKIGNIPCGIAIPQSFANPSFDADVIRHFIPRAEALGYEGLWVQEQIVGDSPILEPVTQLCAHVSDPILAVPKRDFFATYFPDQLMDSIPVRLGALSQ